MEKLKALREIMKSRNIDAYIIFSRDAHSSEYVANYWKARAWFSGFTGSNGTVIVLQDQAGLWTDGRYFTQAENQLAGSEIELFKMNEPNVPKLEDFLAENLPQGGCVGFDGRTITTFDFDEIKKTLNSKSISYAYQEDLLNEIWKERPLMPTSPAFEHEPCFAGLSAAEKLRIVREKMETHKIEAYLVVALDDIAWLLNIRGNDVLYTPVVYSYALITKNEAHIFIDPNKVENFSSKLNAQGFDLHNYDELPAYIKNLNNCSVYFNPRKTNALLSESIPTNCEILRNHKIDILPLLKAAKSETELENIRNAYLKDSAVIVKLLKWLDESDIPTITENDICIKLVELRKEQEHYLEDSFNTIAAYGANAAMAHYHHEGEGATLRPEGFLLIDTGAQYLDGTTDTTRTIALGEISEEMKLDFTMVLKGHIALVKAIFPKGATGHTVDMIARQPVLQTKKNYIHGTGHGIGYCLGVHEGPQAISSSTENTVKLVEGMVVSNEPALYEAGRYGVRTENVLVVRELNDTLLCFENLTFCPIDSRAIDFALLSSEEKKYLEEYHKKTCEVLAPFLSDEENAWLQAN